HWLTAAASNRREMSLRWRWRHLSKTGLSGNVCEFDWQGQKDTLPALRDPRNTSAALCLASFQLLTMSHLDRKRPAHGRGSVSFGACTAERMSCHMASSLSL